MKQYPKTYEDYYSGKQSYKNFEYNISDISSDTFETDEYIKLFRKGFRDYEENLFNNLVKIIWLAKRFCYKKKNRFKLKGNGYRMDKAFTIFIRKEINNQFTIVSRNELNNHISTYFYDFFPDFDAMNPFENEEYFKYPYKYMTLSHLNFVYQIPERLELLKHGEENKMNINVFFDYVINHVKSYNEEIKNDKYYQVNHTSSGSPYIKKEGDCEPKSECENCGEKLRHNQKRFCSKSCHNNFLYKLKEQDGELK